MCSEHIFGCATCEVVLANSQFIDSIYSCTACEANLYLYKHLNPLTNAFQNICVPNCHHADQQTVNDEVNRQCIYLGPFCGISSTTRNSITGRGAPMCKYSYLSDHGFIVVSKFRIM